VDKKTIRDVSVCNRRALVRVDFNVPINEQTGEITDDSRIRASLPTIEYLTNNGAKVILCSHLGRPKGKRDSRYSLEPVARRLSQILREEVKFAPVCTGPEVENLVNNLNSTEILLLENLRFYPDEEDNNPGFAHKLSQLGDIYVNDAFGTSHRKHASIVGITNYLPSVAGLLLEKEINSLGLVLENPKRPFGVLLGGAKVTDKVKLLENTMDKVNFIIVGGGMAATFLKAQGYEVGKSLIDGSLETARMLIDKVAGNGVKLILPDDVMVAESINPPAPIENVPVSKIPRDKMIVDIGTLTITKFTETLEKCRTVFWNGPMGIYEIPRYSEGTRTIAKVMSNLLATTIVGGGSTAEIMTEMKLAEKMTFVSTGGGASLEFLSGEPLPGVSVLMDKELERETITYTKMMSGNVSNNHNQVELMHSLSLRNDKKIVMLVIDGLGGVPLPDSGKTELESADTPNLDSLARKSICGFSTPVLPGITPGSAPGHLGLFGYDPLSYVIGRGVLEAVGIDMEVLPGDVAARGNFCTVDKDGLITDRRAGRIESEKAADLCKLLDRQVFEGIEFLIRPVREHRLVVLMRSSQPLSDGVRDTDPQRTGVNPLAAVPASPQAEKTARAVNQFIARSSEILANYSPANMILLRGFSSIPDIPSMGSIYQLNPAAIAGYPMYRGLARLVGMEVLATGPALSDEINVLENTFNRHDFFFLHVKGADSAGEDGDFEHKVRVIEEVDRFLPRLLALKPDVLVVAGDHSTPAVLKGHSWHPVPLLLYAPFCRPDNTLSFSETSCLAGGLGTIPATSIMPLAMANAQKLGKYGA
jgi:phosphoglycerate kinase